MLAFSAVLLNAQIPFVEYKVVPNYQVNSQGVIVPVENRYSNPHPIKVNEKNKFLTIGGYTITTNGKLKRIKIKVNKISSYGIEYAYIRGVQSLNPNIWNECNTQAEKVDEYTDNEFISNNFEWKVNTAFGVIYFNL